MQSDSLSPEPPPLPTTKRQRQFSLRSLMYATTAFAIFCGLVSALPYAVNQVLVGFIWLVAAGWLVTGLLFAQGDQRAFCVGASVVVSSMWTRIGGQLMQGLAEISRLLFFDIQLSRALGAWLNLALLMTVAIANGWLCIHARRFFERPGGSQA